MRVVGRGRGAANAIGCDDTELVGLPVRRAPVHRVQHLAARPDTRAFEVAHARRDRLSDPHAVERVLGCIQKRHGDDQRVARREIFGRHELRTRVGLVRAGGRDDLLDARRELEPCARSCARQLPVARPRDGAKREGEGNARAGARAARARFSPRHSYIISPAGVPRARVETRAGAAQPATRGSGVRSYPRLRHGIMPGFIITKLTKNPNDDAP